MDRLGEVVVVGGHDRAHYLGGLYDSNMDLAFARARCVAEELKKHFSKPAEKADSKHAVSTSEIHVLTAPGGARFGARVGPDAGRDNPSDRIVEAFIYLQPDKEG